MVVRVGMRHTLVVVRRRLLLLRVAGIVAPSAVRAPVVVVDRRRTRRLPVPAVVLVGRSSVGRAVASATKEGQQFARRRWWWLNGLTPAAAGSSRIRRRRRRCRTCLLLIGLRTRRVGSAMGCRASLAQVPTPDPQDGATRAFGLAPSGCARRSTSSRKPMRRSEPPQGPQSERLALPSWRDRLSDEKRIGCSGRHDTPSRALAAESTRASAKLTVGSFVALRRTRTVGGRRRQRRQPRLLISRATRSSNLHSTIIVRPTVARSASRKHRTRESGIH